MKVVVNIILFSSLFMLVKCGQTFNSTETEDDPLPAPKIFEFILKLYGKDFVRPLDTGAPSVLTHECLGTVISKRHILTAAHCLVDAININDNFLSIRRGFHLVDTRLIDDLSDGFTLDDLGMATRAYIHREFNYEFGLNDVGIIEFDKENDFGITPIKLTNTFVNNFTHTAVAAGYGNYSNSTANETPSALRHVRLHIHPRADCLNSKLVKESKAFDPSTKELCVGNVMQQVEFNDDGGPLLYRYNKTVYQIGISTHGQTDAERTFRYLRVSSYCGWIEMITKNEVKCEALPPLKLPAKAIPPEIPHYGLTAIEFAAIIVLVIVILIIVLLIIIGLIVKHQKKTKGRKNVVGTPLLNGRQPASQYIMNGQNNSIKKQPTYMSYIQTIVGFVNQKSVCEHGQKIPKKLPMVDEWMDVQIGQPFPTRPIIKALGTSLDTVPGENPDQFVALWYQQGEPIMGRAWNENGTLAASFGWLSKEHKCTTENIQVLVENCDHVRGFQYAWRPFRESAIFGEKEWHPVQIGYHKGNISPCVVTLEDGKQLLGKADLRNEIVSAAFNGEEHTFVGPTVHPFLVLCRKANPGLNFD